MSTRRSSERGATIVEFILVVSIFTLFAMVFTDVFSSSSDLAGSSQVRHRAQERLRLNLERLADLLRAAEMESLGGLDSDDKTTTSLSFARVDRVERDGRVYLGSESIAWRAVPSDVDGVAAPGEIVHNINGVERIVATRVPQTGFEVVLEDGSLVIRLSTYYSSKGRVDVARGETSIALRN